MDRDLSKLLEEWPFVPGQISVRVIEGKDHEPRIQVRLDLGILQMEVDGRPDGRRPDGFESLLEYHESRISSGEAFDEPEGDEGDEADEEPVTGPEDLLPEPGEDGVRRFLSAEQCRHLREEAQQYYHRYIALLVLEDFEGVVRDTSRNLRVLDLFRDYAIDEDDQNAMEPHRPYVMMMRARALASHALKNEENKVAINAIDEGIDSLRTYYSDMDRPELFEQAGEVQMLREMREGLVPKLPVSQKAELRQRLEAALAAENYELAAILRDELRMLGG